MIRINALNDGSLPDSSNESNDPVVASKEALEEESYALHRKALEYLQKEDDDNAEDTLGRLLETSFVKKSTVEENRDGPLPPGIMLRYLAHKNLALIALRKGDNEAAMGSFLQAVDIDPTDVSVWYRMGITALKLFNYPLARLSFEEGLQCSPTHWPCLDQVITLSFALNDYTGCLNYIAQGLERHFAYVKGLVFRDQIFRDLPFMRSFSESLFKNCDPQIFIEQYDKDEAKKLIDEAVEIRVKKQELSCPEPLPVLNFRKLFTEFSWTCLGENLIALYDYMKHSDPALSIGCLINVPTVLDSKNSETGSTLTGTSGAERDKDRPASPFSSDSSSDESSTPVTMQTGITHNIETDQGAIEMEDLSDARNLSGVDCQSEEGIFRHRAKRKKMLMDDQSTKRRSARVRNTGGMKKTQDNINYRELLRQFLTSSLLGEGGEDEVEDDSDFLSGAHLDGPVADHTYGQNMPSRQEEEKHNLPDEYKELKENELEDVKSFLEGHPKSTIITLMFRFLVQLSTRNMLLWPTGLTDIYIMVFERWRNHVVPPSLFGSEIDEQRARDIGWITLIHHELQLSKWQVLRSKHSSPTAGTGQRNSGSLIAQLVRDFPGKFFYEDMDFIVHMTPLACVLKDTLKEYVTRVLWFKALFHVLECDMELAVGCLDKLMYIITLDEEAPEFPIYLINCLGNNTITKEGVSKHLELLQRSQSLEEVHRLFELGEYQKVVNLLKLTFTQPHARYKEGSIPERHAQLLLLQDSLWKLKSYNECLYWGEAAFNESLQQYMVSTTTSSTQDWVETMTQLMNGMDKCLKHGKCQLEKLEQGRLVRLTHNLIRAICLQMDGSDLLTSLTPWILIFRVLQSEEQKILRLKPKESTVQAGDKPVVAETGAEASTGIPSSLMLLFTAHDSLGRHGWCCSSDGSFVQLIVDTLMSQLASENIATNPYKEDLEMGVEQCFYCMYGHPNKRTKVKHLQDHNSRQIALTWARAAQVFDFFRPKFLPEFDSYRTSTISAELENLFRRIYFLVPATEDPNHCTEPVVAYIEGGTDKYPISVKKTPVNPIVQELYYLLGDYYFKNKEFGKAIKFYILDICVNPERLDSWAGMALARSSQLEQKLTACDLRSDPTVYRKSSSALRCFKRALELDPSHTALWIEYGSLAYMLHAYASRQLEQQTQFNFPDDMLELLQNKRAEMLNVASHCFLSASRCYQMGVEPVEMWLHHYMLGKIAEKKRSSPLRSLYYYRIAARYLYDEYGKFPKKIHYHNPQDLAIESLEVYYRTHACVLKYLLRMEQKDAVPEQSEINKIGYWLKQATQGPFATCQEKPDSDRPKLNLEVDDAGSSSEAVQKQPETKVRKETETAPTMAALDHTYFHAGQSAADEGNRPDMPSDSSSSCDDNVVVKEVMNFILASIPKDADPRPPAESEMEVDSEAPDPSEENEDPNIDDDVDLPKEIPTTTTNELIDLCVKAVWECHHRFSQHYKSLYRLAHFYFHSKTRQNSNKCRKFLLGGPSGTSYALFAERKNANFFNGIWRIPMDDIDRPGCFASHMYRSVALVVELLHQQKDHAMLLQLTLQLNRTPELGKKYLRESDRLHLAHSTFSLYVGMMRDNMNDLMQEEPPPEESRLISCVLDTYRAWQAFIKASVFPDEANDMLEEAYTVYKLGEVDTSPPVIEQAVSFCQAAQSLYQSSGNQEGSKGSSQPGVSTPTTDSSKGFKTSDSKAVQSSKPVSPSPGGQSYPSSVQETNPSTALDTAANVMPEMISNVPSTIPNVHDNVRFMDSYYRFLLMNCHLGNVPK